MKTVGMLLSGRGSNFIALSDAVESGAVPAVIGLVVSNRADAPGLAEAKKRGYPCFCLDSTGMTRHSFDERVIEELEKAGVEIVCLAGFMRLLSPFFVRRFPLRILNIHPSLLPSFPGLHAQHQALQHGVKVSGCTVHFVDEQLDHGPIVLQKAVPVREDDDVESLSRRILEQEHRIYPQALHLLCEDRLKVEGRRVMVMEKSGN